MYYYKIMFSNLVYKATGELTHDNFEVAKLPDLKGRVCKIPPEIKINYTRDKDQMALYSLFPIIQSILSSSKLISYSFKALILFYYFESRER